MNENMCKFFEVIKDDFPDTLSDGKYQFNNDNIYSTYCDNNVDKCKTDIDKINAGYLYFFITIFGDSESIKNHEKNNMNILQYIIIWLSYMLTRKTNDGISNLNDFYDQYVNKREEYSTSINDVNEYNNYKEIIDKKQDFFNLDMRIISRFYNALKLLCNMYNEINGDVPNCANNHGNANKIINEYQNLLNDNDIGTDGSSYRQMLSTLSTDYDNFKKYCDEKCTGCKSIPSLPTTKTTQLSGHISEDTSSSSSIASKLIPALSIFAIPFFLGIAYKYSLFGFDKRLKIQYLREKLKKLKKKMNNYV
ncbi:Plasmodium variant antigen protein Cir/Yir/Bir, putative [Plasmodium chabaudi adami]|uniref:Plasmodium variant antigen protein Cir/Yir/Bir, putative n=1 Tax=Plasmodium chabaudi adami TaxID=5826 RepID=A0A1C6WY46_PLACE|nr:Plasmodium variant antigen protein Cir/Yir/Bir, putative [Plasmodium chabaudi adami]